MCRASEATEQRTNAARKLLAACASDVFGIGPALRKTFQPIPTGPEWEPLLQALDEGNGE